jgi:hypothetical protein
MFGAPELVLRYVEMMLYRGMHFEVYKPHPEQRAQQNCAEFQLLCILYLNTVNCCLYHFVPILYWNLGILTSKFCVLYLAQIKKAIKKFTHITFYSLIETKENLKWQCHKIFSPWFFIKLFPLGRLFTD